MKLINLPIKALFYYYIFVDEHEIIETRAEKLINKRTRSSCEISFFVVFRYAVKEVYVYVN